MYDQQQHAAYGANIILKEFLDKNHDYLRSYQLLTELFARREALNKNAKHYFTLASACLGSVDAQFEVASQFECGIGCGPNNVAAAAWGFIASSSTEYEWSGYERSDEYLNSSPKRKLAFLRDVEKKLLDIVNDNPCCSDQAVFINELFRAHKIVPIELAMTNPKDEISEFTAEQAKAWEKDFGGNPSLTPSPFERFFKEPSKEET